ncbi:nucleotidyltransferase domain-containing protein [Patescibacteria group bacterium]|nr:nucleotidyltransferase domain-containing protein [Patescibacteria group bacterium]
MLSQEQIQEIIDEIKRDRRIDGILITGSYIYGTPHDQSDLDVRCITNDGSDWGELDRLRFGTRIEVFFNPPDKVRLYMQESKKGGHGDCIHFWANGKIVYDPNGIVRLLQKEAQDLWREGPEPGRSWEWRKEKHKKYEGVDWNFIK